MADFTTGGITSGAGVAGDAQLAANYGNIVINQADVGRELIVKVAKTNITSAELNTIIKGITQTYGTKTGLVANEDSAFTVAAVGTADGSAFVSGTTDVVFLRVQGTGQLTADGSDAYGVNGAVTTIEAVFTPAK